MYKHLIAIGFILVLTDQGRAINGPPWYVYQDIELCLLDKQVFEGYGWKGVCRVPDPRELFVPTKGK